jgi:hypothetical protein
MYSPAPICAVRTIGNRPHHLHALHHGSIECIHLINATLETDMTIIRRKPIDLFVAIVLISAVAPQLAAADTLQSTIVVGPTTPHADDSAAQNLAAIHDLFAATPIAGVVLIDFGPRLSPLLQATAPAHGDVPSRHVTRSASATAFATGTESAKSAERATSLGDAEIMPVPEPSNFALLLLGLPLVMMAKMRSIRSLRGGMLD